MQTPLDLTASMFGRWTVIARAGRNKNGRQMWLVRCECGTERNVIVGSLTSGKSKSCGCLRDDLSGARAEAMGGTNRTHGMTGTSEHRAWSAARMRCSNPRDKHWLDYGGRGIYVCQGFTDFATFYAMLGSKPAGYSLDRINNDGHYSCGACDQCRENGWQLNCRWATAQQQRLNQRRSASPRCPDCKARRKRCTHL